MVVRDGVGFCKKQWLPYFKVLYHPTPAACEETKRTGRDRKESGQTCKASFVLRIEFGTTEFEAEVLTTTQPRLLLGYRSKGRRHPVQPYSTELVFGRGYEVGALTVSESSEPREETHNLVTTSRSNGLPSHGFRVMLHANKHQIAQSVQ